MYIIYYLLLSMIVWDRVSAYTGIHEFSDCHACIWNATEPKYVCRDNYAGTGAFCCTNSSATDPRSAACNTQWCSPMALTDSMKYSACPYMRRQCMYQKNYQTILTKSYDTRTLTMGYNAKKTWRFENSDGCYYELFAADVGENYNFNQEPEATYYINVTVSFQNASVYLNNGTSFKTAGDEQKIILSPFAIYHTYKA